MKTFLCIFGLALVVFVVWIWQIQQYVRETGYDYQFVIPIWFGYGLCLWAYEKDSNTVIFEFGLLKY